jgi:hypothetical protein
MTSLQQLPSTEGGEDKVSSLAQQWAKKYVRNLDSDKNKSATGSSASGDDAIFGGQPEEEVEVVEQVAVVAKTLQGALRNASSQAWQRTEAFLNREVLRHDIDPELIDPWEVSKDIHDIYKKTIAAYSEALPAYKLSLRINHDVAAVRTKYTAIDPRVIAFVSIQFHTTGEILLQDLQPKTQEAVRNYFKVIDDHLYMPLHRAYDAAAQHHFDSPALKLVQHFLPYSTEIAQSICQRVIEIYPNYRCLNGPLNKPIIRTSSVRDVEMFQIYLWVCLLENDLEALQQELFPLCVMIYPGLNVSWELVQQMIFLLGKEFQLRSQDMDTQVLMPFYAALREMFSPAVFA